MGMPSMRQEDGRTHVAEPLLLFEIVVDFIHHHSIFVFNEMQLLLHFRSC